MMVGTRRGALEALAIIALAGAMAFGSFPAAAQPNGAGLGEAAGRDRGLAVLVTQPVNEMPPGMRAAYIDSLHEELMAHGYDPGPNDGHVGERFVHAVRDYQHDADLPVTGVLTKALLDHLKFAQPRIERMARLSPDAPHESDRARLTTAVQQELAARGYYTYKVDGIAGPITREAIRHFQRDAGLHIDGKLDPTLLVEMRENYPYVRAN